MFRSSTLRLGLLVGALLSGACGNSGPPKVAVCKLPPVEDADSEVHAEPSTKELVKLVLGAQAALGSKAPPNECTGQPIAVPPNDCEGERASLPSVVVGDAEVVTRNVSFSERLVWIITKSDGVEGEGPVALVERDEDEGLVVRAIGTLRTQRDKPRLRMSDDGKLLIVDTEKCTDPDDPATCNRSARLLVKRGTRFEPGSVKHPKTLACIAGATIELTRKLTKPLPNGWDRSFELAASWEAKDDVLTIYETVTILDSDPTKPAIPPREFRKVSATRLVKIGEVVASEATPLLTRAMVEFGSLQQADAGAASKANELESRQ